MKEITKKWLEFVDTDFNAAKDLINDLKHAEVIAFHLQQAIEKVLKAYIQENQNEDPPKIHDLVDLMQRTEFPLDITTRKLLEKLTFIYIESRYPSSAGELKDFLNQENIQELYNDTERFLEWIKTKF